MFIIPFNPIHISHKTTEKVIQTNPETEELAFIITIILAITPILFALGCVILAYLENKKERKN